MAEISRGPSISQVEISFIRSDGQIDTTLYDIEIGNFDVQIMFGKDLVEDYVLKFRGTRKTK